MQGQAVNRLVPSGAPGLVPSGVRHSCHQEYKFVVNPITPLPCASSNCSNLKPLTDRSAAASRWTTAESEEQQRSLLPGQAGFPAGRTEACVRQGDDDALQKSDIYTAYLTFDLTPRNARAHQGLGAHAGRDVRRNIACSAGAQISGAHALNVSSQATASTSSSTTFAGQAPLTRVSLAFVAQRMNLYLRFGTPTRIVQLDRWRRVAVFLSSAMFCRIRWEANDYGTTCWQLMVMQACTPLDVAQRIPGVQPGARLLLHTEGERRVRAALERIDAIETHGIAVCDVSPAYWHTLGNRLAAHLPLPDYTAARHAAWLAGRML